MSRKFLFSLIVSTIVISALPSKALAQEPCVQVYGGGVVCGAVAPEHKPVETGLADNLALFGGALILASGVIFYISKKIKSSI